MTSLTDINDSAGLYARNLPVEYRYEYYKDINTTLLHTSDVIVKYNPKSFNNGRLFDTLTVLIAQIFVYARLSNLNVVDLINETKVYIDNMK